MLGSASSMTSITALGDALLESHRSRKPIAPLTDIHPHLTLEHAYAVQEYQVKTWQSEGRRVVGYKVGLTSLAMQEQLGVDQPDFGHLFEDMVLDPSVPISLERFISPKIEPEISFILGKELRGPDLTLDEVVAAVDYAVISLEIIDSRIVDWRIKLADTIGDNASSGALVLAMEHIDIGTVDLSTTVVELNHNGESAATGVGAAVLGHPLNGLLWVANMLGSLGQTLEVGSIVMAGSITKAITVAGGDTVVADFGELGSLVTHFV